jgi:hypothetical protein
MYEIVNYNLKLFDNTKIDFNEIHCISTEGLRNTIDLFFRISPSILDKKLFKRFFIDSYYIKKLHFLGDNFTFTQVENGIFNIFLNNKLYRENLCHKSKFGSIVRIDNSFNIIKSLSSINHLHTYWLKYFILLFLYSEKKNTNLQISNIKELIQTFSPNGTIYKYEENIVRLVLLGLAEVTHGRLLDIILNNDDNIKNFEISDRAIYLLENTIWSFDYISIILEDIWLQYPDFIYEECPYLFEKTNGYCYLTGDTFKEKQKSSFRLKIKQVIFF